MGNKTEKYQAMGSPRGKSYEVVESFLGAPEKAEAFTNHAMEYTWPIGRKKLVCLFDERGICLDFYER